MAIYENPGGFNESLNRYHPGGLHPVLLGDEFDHERYVVFRKLAYGSSATIWLAKDRDYDRYVALKFPCALKEDPGPLRLRIKSGVPGEAYVNLPLDYFVHQGPNGVHLCEALEVVGRTLDQILHDAPHPQLGPYCNVKSTYKATVWLMAFARRVCRQALLGLYHLHARGIAHRAIHAGNLAIALTYDLDAMTEDEIQKEIWDRGERKNGHEMVETFHTYASAHTPEWKELNLEKHTRLVDATRRLDEKDLTPGEAQYRVWPCPLQDKLSIDNARPNGTQDFRAVLIDFGSSCLFQDCTKHSLCNPPNSRSPEAILELRTPYQSDIFSLGLTIWKIVMRKDLIEARNGDEWKSRHLHDLVNRLGPMPARLQEEWAEASEWLNPDGTARSLERDGGRTYGLEDYEHGDVSEVAKLYRPGDMNDEQLDSFLDLMRHMLQWEPEERATTSELLKHPWIVEDEIAAAYEWM